MLGTKPYTIREANEVLQMLADLFVHTNRFHKSAIEELGLSANDVRASTFSKFRSRVNAYLINHYAFTRILESPVIVHEEFYKKVFSANFPKQLTEFLLEDLYKNNRFEFFIKIFSLFEDAVTIILKSVLTECEHDSMQPSCLEALNKSEILFLKDSKKAIYQKLSRKERFIPFIRKVSKLGKKFNLQRDDFHFIEFCNKVRNTMHNNGFYFGPSYKYQEFRLENGKVINFLSEQNVINWARRLINIFDFIVRNIHFPKCIHDPTMQ